MGSVCVCGGYGKTQGVHTRRTSRSTGLYAGQCLHAPWKQGEAGRGLVAAAGFPKAALGYTPRLFLFDDRERAGSLLSNDLR